MVTDPKLVANQFNNYFVTVAENLVKNLCETERNFQDYLYTPNEYSIFLKGVELEEIKEQILKLNMKKSSDFYGISPKLLKSATDKLIEPSSFLFNESVKTGTVLDKLKVAVVYPIQKRIQN